MYVWCIVSREIQLQAKLLVKRLGLALETLLVSFVFLQSNYQDTDKGTRISEEHKKDCEDLNI